MRALAFIALSFFVLSAQAFQVERMFTPKSFPGTVRVIVDVSGGQVSSSKLDVLLVVDDSGSMDMHQRNLAQHIPNLTKAVNLKSVDVNAGVISTSALLASTPGSGGLINGGVLNNSDPNFDQLLQKNILLGVNGDAVEVPFQAAVNALSEPNLSGLNKGFLRADAHLLVVFLTDADDQSQFSALQFYDFLRNLKGPANNILSMGIYIPTTDTLGCQRDSDPAKKLEEFFALTTAATVNLCDPDFPVSLEAASQELAKHIPSGAPLTGIREVPLPSAPELNSIQVRYGSQNLVRGDFVKGWVYDSANNKIIIGQGFEFTGQRLDAKLEIDYKPIDWQ